MKILRRYCFWIRHLMKIRRYYHCSVTVCTSRPNFHYCGTASRNLRNHCQNSSLKKNFALFS
jgi:hypothetical protein